VRENSDFRGHFCLNLAPVANHGLKTFPLVPSALACSVIVPSLLALIVGLLGQGVCAKVRVFEGVTFRYFEKKSLLSTRFAKVLEAKNHL